MSAREAVNIIDRLDQLKRSIENCHPQTPSLSVETALIIERKAMIGNIDELFVEQSIDNLNNLTKLFEDTCSCESTENHIYRDKRKELIV